MSFDECLNDLSPFDCIAFSLERFSIDQSRKSQHSDSKHTCEIFPKERIKSVDITVYNNVIDFLKLL